jgi:hypothetical protein
MLDYTIPSDDDHAYAQEAQKITQALNEAEQRLKATDRPVWLLALSGTVIGAALFASGVAIMRWIT